MRAALYSSLPASVRLATVALKSVFCRKADRVIDRALDTDSVHAVRRAFWCTLATQV